MGSLFWPQFRALVRKNFIILAKHPFLNILRCFILPIAYGVFLAVAQVFLSKPNNYGIGSPKSILTLESQYDPSLAFVWTDASNGTSNPAAADIISRITQNFSQRQRDGIVQVATPADIPKRCPQNFNFFSECYMAIQFNNINMSSSINYTIRGDAGLFHIDVGGQSDFEKRVLSLQWAVDQALIELITGVSPPTPLEWPFTQETNEQQATAIRLSYIRGLRTLLVLALFICYIGVVYHLPGSFSGERATLLTSHLKAMGLLDSARIISWLFTISLIYLPAWIIVAVIWHYRIFTGTNIGLVLVVHLLFGFSLASWSLFAATPFGKSPSLAAVTSTLAAIVLAVLGLVLFNAGNGLAFIFSIIFPPSYYIFAIRAICGFENHQIPTNALVGDPDHGLRLIALIVAAIINIFLWPFLAVLWERRIYDARNPSSWSWRSYFQRTKTQTSQTLPPDVAISVEHLNKTYITSQLGFKKNIVTAVSDLTLSIPKFGIYVLLGGNGAGKSTTLSILAGLTGRTGGSVMFEGGTDKAERGTVGVVPQRNVLFDELTCIQVLQLWAVVKRSKYSSDDEDLEQLLRDCDLETKIHSNAGTLSGGQKRKLQLAIGIVGGSPILLVDECTSGVDPLSRRSIWKTLASIRNERTIIFTTHFLDEADLLADHISILAAPGVLVANGTPVKLKLEMGRGYSVHVSFRHPGSHEKKVHVGFSELLDRIREFAPGAHAEPSPTSGYVFNLETKDREVVQKILFFIEENKEVFAVSNYDIIGTSIEDIFLDLMSDNHSSSSRKDNSFDETLTLEHTVPVATPPALMLDDGKFVPFWSQAATIFHKRVLISKRSWLAPLLLILVAVAGSTIPLVFIQGRTQTCVTKFRNTSNVDLFLPSSPLRSFPFGSSAERLLTSPPSVVLDTLGSVAQFLRVSPVTDNATFVEDIEAKYLDLELGGVSFNKDTMEALVAWEGSPPGLAGPTILNTASNLIYNTARNKSGSAAVPSIIRAYYSPFPPINAGTLVALKWVAFFGATMAVFPAFFALYVSRERRSLVQSMQMSNGLSNPVGLWLGHLLFDSIFSVLIATLIVIIFATASDQFHGLGFFWLIIVLYGITGALLAYCASLFTASPLAAFAAVAGYQIVMYILYLAGYLLTLTYAKTSDADWIITTLHFTLSVCSPVASAMRAAFVSVNLFSLLCDGIVPITTSSLGTITRYGGPIVYLILYSIFLFGVLVWVDSGSILPRTWRKGSVIQDHRPEEKDVQNETRTVSASYDILRVLGVSKTFGSNRVVDDVSLGVSRDTIFCLLGANGAGKTTTFALIRGDIIPDTGQILVDNTSVVHHPRIARQSLGFCPQFTAIDSQLTVREHLMIYGRLKGLDRGDQLQRNVESLMQATSLSPYGDRLASKLSGGNQRKLSLAIALIGNPSVILVDEFSTGVDAKMKRDMWITLRHVAANKAILMTTHSMEEASALANKVGITRSREDITRAQQLMANIQGSKLVDDVATRFEVPINNLDHGNEGMSLAKLFSSLSAERGNNFAEYTIEKATLESIFLKLVRQNGVREEDEAAIKRRRWWFF